MDLINSLIKAQDLAVLSDAKFAEKLGVDPSTWSYIKRRKYQPGHKFLMCVLRVYPELLDAVTAYLGMKRKPPFRIAHRFLHFFNVKFHLDKRKRLRRCAACGRKLGDTPPADSLKDKLLCAKCYKEGWRLKTITYRGEGKPKRLTIAWKPIGRDNNVRDKG